jgi:hypothetical protein
MTREELFRMGYNGECDGHSRSYHALIAADRRELDMLIRGANQAKSELEQAEREFRPSGKP